jgi:hypothetical protein
MVLVSGALAGIFCRVEVYSEENHLDEENLYAQKHICSVIVTTRKQSLFVLSLSLIIRKHSRKRIMEECHRHHSPGDLSAEHQTVGSET